jgi:hypothetical protein
MNAIERYARSQNPDQLPDADDIELYEAEDAREVPYSYEYGDEQLPVCRWCDGVIAENDDSVAPFKNDPAWRYHSVGCWGRAWDAAH